MLLTLCQSVGLFCWRKKGAHAIRGGNFVNLKAISNFQTALQTLGKFGMDDAPPESPQPFREITLTFIIIIIIIQQMPTRQLLTSAIQTQHTRGLQQYQSKRFGHNALLQWFTITINGSSSDGLTTFKNIQVWCF